MQEKANEIIEVQEEAKLDDEKKWCVYVHTNKINGKKYVGITSKENPKNRWKNGHGYRYNEYFWNAIQKYGWNNFSHEILSTNLTIRDACQAEMDYIKLFNCKSPNGYNNSYGGDGHDGHAVTQEARKKISEANKGRLAGENNPMYGKNPYANKTEEEMAVLKERWSNASSGENNPMYGKTHPAETRKKISNALMGKLVGESNPFYGKHHTEETKAHLREINTGKRASDETKQLFSRIRQGKNNPKAHPVYCVEMNEYFWGPQDVKNKYPTIPITNIGLSCNDDNRTCGRHPVTNEKLHWRWTTMEEYDLYMEGEDIDGTMEEK